MVDDHLLNTIRMLRRNAVRRRNEEVGEEESPHWSIWASSNWTYMMLEAEHRGGEVWRLAQEILQDRELEPAPYPKRT